MMPHPAPTPWLPPWRLILLPAVILAAVLTPVGLRAADEPSSRPAPADPSNAVAAVPPLTYRSVLGSYRPLGETALRDWKDVNQEVNRLGGWRAYAREAQQALNPAPMPRPAPVAPAAGPSSAPATRPGGAGGHQGHH